MNRRTAITFDTSLSTFVDTVSELFGTDALRDGVFVRDATGRLSFALNRDAPSAPARTKTGKKIVAALGHYARADRVLVYRDDPGANRILKEPNSFPVEINGVFCHVIDRRIVGAGWVDIPAEEHHSPPRIVFASIKGGVGRSTALAVAAADLAYRGRNVLVLDLDLEAPGLGDLLLTEDRLPPFGTVDYLVENGIGGVADTDIDRFVGSSPLTTSAGGRVDVSPALGQLSNEHPANVLPKLARAEIDDISEGAVPVSVARQMSAMISSLTGRSEYDVVLVDARAGLAEIAAPVILGLGATVLLFGTAQKQTIDGYRALFAGLKLLAQRDREAKRAASWRFWLKAVLAKATLDSTHLARHREDLYDLFSEYIYDAEDTAGVSAPDFSFSANDAGAPHWPLVIPFSPNFVDFDSARNRDHLALAFYEQAFRPFLNGLDQIIQDSKDSAEIIAGESE